MRRRWFDRDEGRERLFRQVRLRVVDMATYAQLLMMQLSSAAASGCKSARVPGQAAGNCFACAGKRVTMMELLEFDFDVVVSSCSAERLENGARDSPPAKNFEVLPHAYGTQRPQKNYSQPDSSPPSKDPEPLRNVFGFTKPAGQPSKTPKPTSKKESPATIESSRTLHLQTRRFPTADAASIGRKWLVAPSSTGI